MPKFTYVPDAQQATPDAPALTTDAQFAAVHAELSSEQQTKLQESPPDAPVVLTENMTVDEYIVARGGVVDEQTARGEYLNAMQERCRDKERAERKEREERTAHNMQQAKIEVSHTNFEFSADIKEQVEQIRHAFDAKKYDEVYKTYKELRDRARSAQAFGDTYIENHDNIVLALEAFDKGDKETFVKALLGDVDVDIDTRINSLREAVKHAESPRARKQARLCIDEIRQARISERAFQDEETKRNQDILEAYEKNKLAGLDFALDIDSVQSHEQVVASIERPLLWCKGHESELLTAGQVMVLAGRGGCGKSTLALSIAHNITSGISPADGLLYTAGGMDWGIDNWEGALDIHTPRNGAPVIYATGEDDSPFIKRQYNYMQEYADAKQAGGRGQKNGTGKMYYSEISKESLFRLQSKEKYAPQEFLPTRSWEALWRGVMRVKPMLVIIDPVAAFGGNPNDMEIARLCCNETINIAKTCDAAVIFIAHTNKAGRSKGGLIEDTILFGSAGWVDRPRAIMVMAKHPTQERARTLTVVKANRAPVDIRIDIDPVLFTPEIVKKNALKKDPNIAPENVPRKVVGFSPFPKAHYGKRDGYGWCKVEDIDEKNAPKEDDEPEVEGGTAGGAAAKTAQRKKRM